MSDEKLLKMYKRLGKRLNLDNPKALMKIAIFKIETRDEKFSVMSINIE